jgi:hypothetical protein
MFPRGRRPAGRCRSPKNTGHSDLSHSSSPARVLQPRRGQDLSISPVAVFSRRDGQLAEGDMELRRLPQVLVGRLIKLEADAARLTALSLCLPSATL